MTPSALVGLWLGCAEPPHPSIAAQAVDGGIEVVAEGPLGQVSILDGSGRMVAQRSPLSPATRIHVPIALRPSEPYTALGSIDGVVASTAVELPTLRSVRVELELPLGQPRIEVEPDAAMPVTLVSGRTVPVRAVLTALEPVEMVVHLGDTAHPVALRTAGERVVIDQTLDGVAPVPVEVRTASRTLRATITPHEVSAAQAREQLAVTALAFPTDAVGRLNRALPPDRVTLSAEWWRAVKHTFGLGLRPRSDQAPWAHQSVTLVNRSDHAVNVVVRGRIVDDTDREVSAFRPRIRNAPGQDEVRVLLAVGAGQEVRTALPVWVDDRLLRGGEAFERVIDVIPLGSDVPLHTLSASLVVTRASGWASLGLLVALTSSAAGWLWLVTFGRRQLRLARTRDLVTVALFGSLSFVVSLALQVIGTGFGWVLGPFSIFVMGIPGQIARTTLLGTLVMLLPRPGVVALATLVGFLMRGLTLGSLHPVDLVYVGSTVCFTETALWIAGVTRGKGGAAKSRLVQWLRLSAAFGFAGVVGSATGLAVSATFYRLFYAQWYVLAMLALPGFAYIVIGCGLAVPFAASLREVES